MIPVPKNFTVVSGEDGQELVLYPPAPAGRDTGEVHYFAHAGPLRPIETIVSEAIAGLPDLQVLHTSAPERLITAEGEYATFVKIAGRLGEWPLALYVGMVFLDDFVSLLRVLSWEPPALEKIARELLYRCRLGLGVRRRRFLYDPPPGWSAQTVDQVVTFLPPDFPRNLTSITVFPANPLPESAHSVYEAWLEKEWQQGFIVAESLGPWPVSSQNGVHGSHFRITGRYRDANRPEDDDATLDPAPLQRELVVLQQAPYLYVLRLDTAVDEHLEEQLQLFSQLVNSVQPVPCPIAGEAMSHYAL